MTSLHTRLLRATGEFADADELAKSIRRILVDSVVSTVLHVQAGERNDWDSATIQATGDLPEGRAFSDQVIAAARAAHARKRTQVQRLAEKDPIELICVPVSRDSESGSVLAAIRDRSDANLATVLQALELAAEYERLWSRGNDSSAAQWKLNSLAAIIELVSKIEDQSSIEEAAFLLANETARYLDCTRVAVAIARPNGLRLTAISGMNSFDRQSETIRAMQDAVVECHSKNAEISWPPQESQTSPLAHRLLAEKYNFRIAFSLPLSTPDGNLVGAWLFSDRDDRLDSDRMRSFARAASPRFANAMKTVAASRSRSSWYHSASKALLSRRGWIALAGMILCATLLATPMSYRVRCECVIEPVERRYAVAPFAGIIEEGYAEAGDLVGKNTLLARMDGRELGLELSAARAKRGQTVKQRDVELSEQSISDVVITQLEMKRIDTRLALLSHRADHLEIRSPIDGVVLRGSLEKSQSAPVEIGQVLYEIGPLENLVIEVEIPSDEMAQVKAGQAVRIWIEGFEREPIDGILEEVLPESEQRDQRNVFIAKVHLDNTDSRFRPGMRGSARITGPRHHLAWNLFHKPWEFLLSRLTW
ncbi:MAG: HlyD family efflux transporter periplasmic adaptor subunit [Planctomycetota bacterium]